MLAMVPLMVVGTASPLWAQGDWVYDDAGEKKKKEQAEKDKEKKKAEEIKAAEAKKPADVPKEGETAAAPAAAPPAETPPEEDMVDPEDRSPIDGVKGHIGIGYFTDFAPLGGRLTASHLLETAFDELTAK